ncbi:MAG: hypothetical protein KDD06_15935 [Phaeodactylibacter sp.]|nr:hypothetical protein [Phaeodactylibacter sp.]MCB9266695.1 hypothetical protein [Lewinellaceae bacterium]MCB9289006.1 hypothetical protein [Lewinellaceae bacterium]
MKALIFFSSASFLTCSLFCPVTATGQDAPLSRQERTEIAHESIKTLKDGVLIVRLPFYQTKVDGLKDVLSSTGPDSPNRKRIEKQLEETLASRKEFNQNMMAAFGEAYDFSKVYFMPDTATASLKSGQLAGFFLNESLEPDPSIRLEGKPPYYILRFGSTSDMTTDGLEAMVIMNDQFQDLDNPFPYYQRLHDFAAVMGSIFPVPDQKKKDALRIVGKLNGKLNSYYEQVVGFGGGL